MHLVSSSLPGENESLYYALALLALREGSFVLQLRLSNMRWKLLVILFVRGFSLILTHQFYLWWLESTSRAPSAAASKNNF